VLPFLVGVKARLRGLRYGFLVIPFALTAALGALGFVLVAVDRALGPEGAGFGVANDAEAARTVLTAIATSFVTVAGVVFSITMVTLQLVSQQFSPRALREFLGDRLTQVVAGAFVGVFVFCLLVLRTVSGADSRDEPFVPALSVTVAIVLAVAALVVLLAFIDHMGRRIPVSSIAGGITKSTLAALDRLYPAPYGEPEGQGAAELVERWHEQRGEPEVVHADRPGYIQSVRLDNLPSDAGSPGARMIVHVAPGDFVTERQALASWWPGREEHGIGRALRLAIVVADERDIAQDPAYGVRQLADIATKAISPGINDPTTAWTCIRYLQAVLEHLAGRQLPDPVRRYDDDIVVVVHQQRFDEYVEAAYAQVGRYADDPRIAGALLKSVATARRIAADAGAHDRFPPLSLAARRIARTALAADLVDEDREEVERLLAAATGEAAGDGVRGSLQGSAA
jgi:uncharacterized membrane protein